MIMVPVSHSAVERFASFRFYEELNDFLPKLKRRKLFSFSFSGRPSVKDCIEAIGVPHCEVDLVLVDGRSVDFSFQLFGGERVAVYPVFESFDISPVVRLRPRPLRVVKFVVDVNLGKLASYLRLLGFDCVYCSDLEDDEVVRISVVEKRIILSRDVGLLKHGQVTHGYWVRHIQPKAQVREVVRVLQLQSGFKPFSRCAECNGLLVWFHFGKFW